MKKIPTEGFDTNQVKRLVYKKIIEGFMEDDGYIYDNLPLNNGTINNKIDIVLLSKNHGFFVIDIFTEVNIDLLESSVEVLKDKFFDLQGRFSSHSKLRKDDEVIYKGKAILVCPSLKRNQVSVSYSKNLIILTEEDIYQIKEKMIDFSLKDNSFSINDEEWLIVKSIINGNPGSKSVHNQELSHNSKAYIIQQVQAKISELDYEQLKVARQIPPGPQRIRGLAGSGKTIVLAMKAALMHISNPSWDIAYIFYNTSLYEIIIEHITMFTQHFAKVNPDWNKLKVLHGWGNKHQMGLYSYVCKENNTNYLTVSQASALFGNNNSLLGKCCMKLVSEHNVQPKFDAILMDEAQDFDFDFYKFCMKVLKEPYRLIWAYDEVQSLSSLDIPTAVEIFGVDNDGKPLVELDGTYIDDIEKDYILYHCYRNPRPVLLAAHFFGMGVFRKEGAIQFIPKPGGWEDIGYEIVKGDFTPNTEVTLHRPFENSPNLVEKYVGYENVLQTKLLNSFDAEISWVADSIKENIQNEKIKPEEILVVCLDIKNYKSYATSLEHELSSLDVRLFHEGSNTNFKKPGFVTYSGIRRAKGNEANIVYVLGFDWVNRGIDIVQRRNIAFTAMTRCKGWCYLTGMGNDAKVLFQEINKILENPEEITFIVPSPEKIQRTLDNIEYEKRRNRINKSEVKIKELLKSLKTGDVKFLNEELVNSLLETLQEKR
ncbi:ATP-binding domain-containing protein [Priestia aryabhattai]|uniref:DEAD/DEAH box helicase n=1 Tax=Priestia aryabhattai TaxID=412384 RepID=UPI002E2020CE|nr:ATP-binding domain-containing protein [Priestia aryabhattai]